MKTNLTIIATASCGEDAVDSATAHRETLQPIALHWLRRFWRAVLRWRERLWMDDRTVYLSEATSHADLECRIRAWDDAHRRALLPFF